MTIDLRDDFLAFRAYICRIIEEHIQAGKTKPKMIQFGFTFDQDGWIIAHLDTRPNASVDGEWTRHITPETFLHRPQWHAAAELSDLHDLDLIGISGEMAAEWSGNPNLQLLADIFGIFLKSSVTIFIDEGIFRPLFESKKIDYCIEEFTGLFCRPLDPEKVKFAELLRAKLAP